MNCGSAANRSSKEKKKEKKINRYAQCVLTTCSCLAALCPFGVIDISLSLFVCVSLCLCLSLGIQLCPKHTTHKQCCNIYSNQFSITNNFHFTHTHTRICCNIKAHKRYGWQIFVNIIIYLCQRVCLPFWNVVKLFGDNVIIKSLGFTSVHQTQKKTTTTTNY